MAGLAEAREGTRSETAVSVPAAVVESEHSEAVLEKLGLGKLGLVEEGEDGNAEGASVALP